MSYKCLPLEVALCLMLPFCFSGALSAKNYPTRPIRIVVPFPAGGNTDSYIRTLAHNMDAGLGQSLVMDNRGGANGIVGCDIVAKAQPDGYTLLATSFAFVVNPAMYRSLPYDTAKDFTPITNYANGLGYILAVNPSVPVQNVKELIALAKKQPLRYASAGIGNGQHLGAVLFSIKAGIEMQHIPYKGGGPALTAVLSGEVHINLPAASVATPHVKGGRLKGLGFTGKSRISSLPDMPTVAESGLPGFFYDTGWHGIFGPAKLPKPITARLLSEVRKALTNPQLRESFISTGYEPAGAPTADFEKMFRDDIVRYAQIVQVANIEKQ